MINSLRPLLPDPVLHSFWQVPEAEKPGRLLIESRGSWTTGSNRNRSCCLPSQTKPPAKCWLGFHHCFLWKRMGSGEEPFIPSEIDCCGGMLAISASDPAFQSWIGKTRRV